MSSTSKRKLKDTGERLIPEGQEQTLTYSEHLARYKAALGLIKGKVVLDIACGAGYGTALLASQAKKVIGVDYNKDAVAYAQQLYKKSNLSFVQGDAQALPLKDASIDVVVSLETIEHLPDPETFIQEVLRVLKPGGIFYVSTPNDDEYMEGNEFHLHEFTFKGLSALIDKSFKKAAYYYQGTWYASGIMSEENFTKVSQPVVAGKTFGQPTKSAIYFLAVATNGRQLPALEENIIAGDIFSELRSFREHKARQEVLAEKERLEKEVSRLDKELSAILNSKGWKLLTKVYATKGKLR